MSQIIDLYAVLIRNNYSGALFIGWVKAKDESQVKKVAALKFPNHIYTIL